MDGFVELACVEHQHSDPCIDFANPANGDDVQEEGAPAAYTHDPDTSSYHDAGTNIDQNSQAGFSEGEHREEVAKQKQPRLTKSYLPSGLADDDVFGPAVYRQARAGPAWRHTTLEPPTVSASPLGLF